MSKRVVVIGGTGTFGTRLAERLAATTDLAVVIAARHARAAEDFATVLRARYPGRPVEACALDAARLTADDLRRLEAWCVVDAAGPFQGAPPRVAEAAIAARCHYVDLADARDFVAAFPRLDEAARAAGVLAVTGASSTPGLGQAVLDALVAGWRRVDSVEIAISPGNRQPRGLSVVQAILSRAGQPIRLFRHGQWTNTRGMSRLCRRRMPGLGRRWLFLIDTPDLDLVPLRFKPRREAIWRAGLELAVLHLGVWGLSLLVAARVLPSLVPLARPLRVIADWFRALGKGRGGMMVTAQGLDRDGRPVVATWALIAHEADGPHVPVLPALALVRALANGSLTQVGAMPCAGVVPLAAIAREFAPFRIVTRTMVRPRPLFARVLGGGFARLPEAVRSAHLVDERLMLVGRAEITGAVSRAGRWLARLFGFPATADDIAVSVEMRAHRDGEVWTRSFGGRRFRSRLTPTGRRGRVRERFGPFTFDLMLTASADGLDLEATGARVGPLPLPRALLPTSQATEHVDAKGRFRFDIPIVLPVVGLLVHYRGWLVPQTS